MGPHVCPEEGRSPKGRPTGRAAMGHLPDASGPDSVLLVVVAFSVPRLLLACPSSTSRRRRLGGGKAVVVLQLWLLVRLQAEVASGRGGPGLEDPEIWSLQHGDLGLGGPTHGGPELRPKIGGTELRGPELGGPKLGGPQLGCPELGSPKLGSPELRGPQSAGPALGGAEPEVLTPKAGAFGGLVGGWG